MTADQLRALIAAGLPCEHLEVDGDGRHWTALVVSAQFEGKRPIQRHQRVMPRWVRKCTPTRFMPCR